MKNPIVNVTLEESDVLSVEQSHPATSRFQARALPIHPGTNQKLLLFLESAQVKVINGNNDPDYQEAPPEDQALTEKEGEALFNFFFVKFHKKPRVHEELIIYEAVHSFSENQDLVSAFLLYKYGEYKAKQAEDDDTVANLLLHSVPAMQPEIFDFMEYEKQTREDQ